MKNSIQNKTNKWTVDHYEATFILEKISSELELAIRSIKKIGTNQNCSNALGLYMDHEFVKVWFKVIVKKMCWF